MGNRTCSLDDCPNAHFAKGFCAPHFNRWKRHGDPLAGRLLHSGKTCEVEGCNQPVNVRQWCTNHYNNWRRTGEPVRKRTASEARPLRVDAKRTCTKCGAEKPLEAFSPAKGGKFGRRSQCKICLQEDAGIRREAKRTRPPLWARRPEGTPGSAWCASCRVFKESKNFRLDPRNSDGFRSQCRDCDQEIAARRDRSNDKETLLRLTDPATAAVYRRRNTLLVKYGMTLEDYDRLLAFQGGKCAICGSDDPRSGRHPYFHVDHDHDTKEVRGLLCSPCNTGLGGLADSADRLRKAIAYLAFSPYKAFVGAVSEPTVA